jgi:hypothetical protein
MSTKFQFNLTDAWWVALSQGHSACRLLRIAADIESEYDVLHAKIQSLEFGGSEYLTVIGKCLFLTEDMLKISSACVAAFQAMMEGLINNAIASETALANVKVAITNKKGEWDHASFEQKWIKSLVELRQSSIEFESYNKSIYKRFRIPLIHPHDAKLADIDLLEFAVMRDGFRAGWMAYERLYDGLGKSHDPNSWQTMCQQYGIDG